MSLAENKENLAYFLSNDLMQRAVPQGCKLLRHHPQLDHPQLEVMWLP